MNISSFKPIEGFTAVGVGPLSFDERFVTKGEPLKVLKGGLRFMAQRMKVSCPPMPVSTKVEHHMLNTFLSHHPKYKKKDLVELCKDFHRKSNGKTIFPKLVSLLSPAIERWKINQQTIRIGLQTQEGFTKLLERIQTYVSLEPPSPLPLTQALVLPSEAQPHVNWRAAQPATTTALALHVGPPSTTGQTVAVTSRQSLGSGRGTVSTAQKSCDCAWYLFCKEKVCKCGG